MARPLTTRETFAGVLTGLVQARCNATRTARISRTGLQSEVPVQERPAVRRGLDALVDHGILSQTAHGLGITPLGEEFARHVTQAGQRNGPAARPAPTPNPQLSAALSALQAEDRLDPTQPFEDLHTLPARLENFRAQRAPAFWRYAAVLLLILVAVVAAVRLR